MDRRPGDANAVPPASTAYTERRDVRRNVAETLLRRERWISQVRLVVFLLALGASWLAFGVHVIPSPAVAVPVVAFLGLLVFHDRVIQHRTRAERAARHYEHGLARLEDRWTGMGATGDTFRDRRHPYATDLDIFGDGSLFQLLCTARTAAGEAQLARWLCESAGVDEVRARQAAVEELRPNLALREDLALLGEDLRSHLDPTALVHWGAEPPAALPTVLRPIAAAIVAATLGAIALLFATEAGPVPLALALLVQSGFAWWLRSRIHPILSSVSRPTRELALFRGLLERIEREPCNSPRLAELRAALDTEGHPPSEQIRRLQRLVDYLDARGNQFFAPFGALLLWGTQISLAIEHWRAHCGPTLGQWVRAAAEIEALSAISGYAYEHPDDPFPELVEPATQPASQPSTQSGRQESVYVGRQLGHPLLPRGQCVRNDIALGAAPQAFIMSGSNMSGKSTMLRTVGTNAVLALAGAPICGEALRLSPVAVAASIQVSDSLQDGSSHFYAEITRLRQVVELADQERPVLFLLDEILHGTNSHDRRIGAEAVVRGLLERGAVGVVTTHDLALAEIADAEAPRLANVHFQDDVVDGRMHFDYALRPGVVTKSNAIELMRSIGLEV